MPPRGRKRQLPTPIDANDEVAEMLKSSTSKFPIPKQPRWSRRLRQRQPSPLRASHMQQTLNLIHRETVATPTDGNCGSTSVVISHQPCLGMDQQGLRDSLATFLMTADELVLSPIWDDLDYQFEAKYIAIDTNWFRTFHLAACAVMLKRDIALIHDRFDHVQVMSRTGGTCTSMSGQQFALLQQGPHISGSSEYIIICLSGRKATSHFHGTRPVQPTVLQ
jgi:hypothetical protein